MADEMQEPQVAQQPQVTAATDLNTDTANSTPIKVSFGLSSFTLPTPESARQGFKLFLLLNSIIVLIVNGFPQIPLEAKNLVLQFSTVANLIANKLEDFYGIKLS